MNVKTAKLTNISLMHKACEATMHGAKSRLSLVAAYKCLHSVARTQLFYIEMTDIPTYISVHLVRHSIGVTHFVTSNRPDRGGGEEITRDSPVNHSMLINAEALINMARKRLCGQASGGTRAVMALIKGSVCLVDSDLAVAMVRECQFRNGYCPELKCCGNLWRPDEQTA